MTKRAREIMQEDEEENYDAYVAMGEVRLEMSDAEHFTDGTNHTYSGRVGYECDCGRVVSLHDREYHETVECSVEPDTDQDDIDD
jgi:hypothetical protein